MRGKWFADKKTLCEYMCISESYFDLYFLHDDRMKACEYRRGNKVVWETAKAEKYVKDIWRDIAG